MLASRQLLTRVRPQLVRSSVRSFAATQQATFDKGSSSTAGNAAAFGLLGALAAAGTAALMEAAPPHPTVDDAWTAPAINKPPPRPDLPIYTIEQVAEHSDEDSLWYTFRGGVYDMTFFLNGHPGGTPRLLMAAGQDLEPYWEIYRQHLRGHVTDWMEEFRIGSLSPEETEKASKAFEFGDMYENEPIRNPDLLACTTKPFCGEPALDRLTESYYTPNDLFYVRNHLAVPDIDEDEYELIVKGRGVKKHKFTLNDIKTMFPKHEVVTTLQCAGNRREDLHDRGHKVFIAPHWVVGAISCAKWGGAKLRDVLKHCGLDVDGMAFGTVNPKNIKHIQFEAYDIDETGMCYGGSIPIDKAVDPLGDCLVAYEMNGEKLPRDHGFPVRAIAPGHAGARQAKWLHKIIVHKDESQKTWQQKSYRGFAPDIRFEKDLASWPPPRLDQAPIVQEMPVQSLVCNPPQNTIVGAKGHNEIEVKGVAWSGGGKEILRVDVSIDGGDNWTAAELYKPIEQRRNRHWAWTHFHKTMKLSDVQIAKLKRGEKVKLDVTSKAMNSDFNLQPERMEPYFNARGVCINHWYHVNTVLDPYMEPGKVAKNPHVEHEFRNTPSGGQFTEKWGKHGWTSDPEHVSDPRAHQNPNARF